MNHKLFLLMISSFILSVQCNFTLLNTALNEPIQEHFTAIYNNTLMLIAGTNPSGPRFKYATIAFPLNINPWNDYVISPRPNNWTQMLIVAQQTVQIADNVYLMNPYELPTAQLCFIYSLKTNTYSTIPDVTFHAAGPCIVYHDINNLIYVINRKYVHTLNVSSHEWLLKTTDTNARRDYAGCSFDVNHEYIYYFGGILSYNPDRYTDRIQKYSLTTDSWSNVSDTISAARDGLLCYLLAIDAYIYCIGGQNNDVVSNIVDVFDPETETIVHEMETNIARLLHSVTLLNDNRCIIVSGGINNSSAVLDSIEYFGDCSDFVIAPTDLVIGSTDLAVAQTEELTTIPTFISTVITTAGTYVKKYEDTKQNSMVLWTVLIACTVYTVCVCVWGILYIYRENKSLMMEHINNMNAEMPQLEPGAQKDEAVASKPDVNINEKYDCVQSVETKNDDGNDVTVEGAADVNNPHIGEHDIAP